MAQGLEHIPKDDGSSDSHRVGLRIDGDLFEGAQVDGDAVLDFAQARGKAVASPRGKKRDAVVGGEFDLQM